MVTSRRESGKNWFWSKQGRRQVEVRLQARGKTGQMSGESMARTDGKRLHCKYYDSSACNAVCSRNCPLQDDVIAEPNAALVAIAKAYEIEIVVANARFPVRTAHGRIDGGGVGNKALSPYTDLFVSEFQLYPTDIIKKAKLKRVVLCKELAFDGQARTAIPDFEHDTLYLDVERGGYNKSYQRAVLHHEFFHIIDYGDDGNLYTDKLWEPLNTSGFKYGDGGRKAQDVQTTSILTDKFPGFLNHYSTTGVEEDKAELFAHLIIHSAYVEERATKDAVVKTKVERMREMLSGFCPDMNDKFWTKVRQFQRIDK